jgi:hypothetical protein
MKRSRLIPIALLIAAAGCDKPAPTQPRVSAQKVTASTTAPSKSGSTVCRAYRKQLQTQRLAQAAAPRDVRLQKKVANLKHMVTNACGQ